MNNITGEELISLRRRVVKSSAVVLCVGGDAKFEPFDTCKNKTTLKYETSCFYNGPYSVSHETKIVKNRKITNATTEC